jgi:hypothetical protein
MKNEVERGLFDGLGSDLSRRLPRSQELQSLVCVRLHRVSPTDWVVAFISAPLDAPFWSTNLEC